jgi:hypothetical protein
MLGRPLSMLTFAFEHAFMDGSTATLKRNSIVLHLSISALVLWFGQLICKVQGYRHETFLGLIVMALWSLAPQQTSTVLYAVQRMAMLSTFLVLLSLIFYVKARLSLGQGRAVTWVWGGGSLVCIFLAPFAKENGLLAVPLIIAVEATFLRGRMANGRVIALLCRGSQLSLAFGVLAALIYFWMNLEPIQHGYDGRAFTLKERLLTQPVVLWDYIRQFYWPDLSRMGVFHDDVTVYSTFVDPVWPLLAITAWVLILTMSIAAALLGSSAALSLLGVLLFYVVAHSMESSFFALELYFEHRNYLPSIALALLPALLIGELGRRGEALVPPLIAWSALAIFILALHTVTQVQIWSSSTLLSIHHLNGHPQSVRANNDMATRLAELGDFDAALKYSRTGFTASQAQKAARTERDGDFRLRNVALACMAGDPVPVEELSRFGLTHPERPAADTNTLEVLVALQRDTRCPRFDWDMVADRMREVYLLDPAPSRASVGIYRTLAVLMNNLSRLEDGRQYAQLGLLQAKDDVPLLFMRLHFAKLGRETELASDLVGRLQALEQQGRLSARDSQNLSLYVQ